METPEERAAHVIEKELGIPIVVNDDKSGTSKYDPHGPPDAPRVAIEHTSARDEDLMRLMNALSNVSPLSLEGVKGAWVVDLDREGRTARNINRRVEGPRAKRHLAEALRMLEQRGISSLLDHYRLERDASGLAPFSGITALTEPTAIRAPLGAAVRSSALAALPVW